MYKEETVGDFYTTVMTRELFDLDEGYYTEKNYENNENARHTRTRSEGRGGRRQEATTQTENMNVTYLVSC